MSSRDTGLTCLPESVVWPLLSCQVGPWHDTRLTLAVLLIMLLYDLTQCPVSPRRSCTASLTIICASASALTASPKSSLPSTWAPRKASAIAFYALHPPKSPSRNLAVPPRCSPSPKLSRWSPVPMATTPNSHHRVLPWAAHL